MSARREWKPGDVAMVRWTDSQREEIALVHTVGRNLGVTVPSSDGLLAWGATDPAIRPLAVIDYEDREGVKALARTLNSHGLAFCNVDDIAAALREFANPTPPGRRCVAHGERTCVDCSRITSDYLTDDGECSGCRTWGFDGMHWDTCPGRIRGEVFANRDEAVAQ